MLKQTVPRSDSPNARRHYQTLGVMDETSVIIACSELGRIGEINENVTAETMASAGTFTLNGYTYKSFGNHPKPEYAVFVSGNDSEAVKYANLLAVSLGSIKQYYDEKYDRSNFIKKCHFGQHSAWRYLFESAEASL